MPKGKLSTKNKQETKKHIPNLIYVALHVLFYEIHIKENSSSILKCTYLVTRTQATGDTHSKIKIRKKKNFPCFLSSLRSHPCDSRSELLGVNCRYKKCEHMHTSQSSQLAS